MGKLEKKEKLTAEQYLERIENKKLKQTDTYTKEAMWKFAKLYNKYKNN